MSRATTAGVPPDPKPPAGSSVGVQGERSESRSDAEGALDAGADSRRSMMRDREAPPLTFGEMLPQTLAVKALEWSPGSRARFEGIASNYLGRWSDAPFDQIRRADVLDWLAVLRDRGMSAATLVKVLAVFRAVWAEALREGVAVTADPSAGIPIRKGVPVMGRTLSGTELAALVGAASGDDALQLQLLLTGVMGLRWGEVAALSCGDIDVDAGVVNIRANLARGRGEYVIKAPKTSSSVRAVAVPPAMAGLLARVRGSRSGPLFLTQAGARLNYHSSRRALVRVADRAGVVDCSGWHVLRRTAATLALQGGLTLRDVQSMLGHSTPSQTLTAYVAARETAALAAPLDQLARRALGRPLA